MFAGKCSSTKWNGDDDWRRGCYAVPMPDYRKLRVFHLAQELSEAVHRLVPELPARKAPGLVSQLCRSVSSVPTNIAEGAARDSPGAYVSALVIARGSAHETAVHLRLAASVANVRAAKLRRFEQRAHVVAAMLTNLIATIQKDAAISENDRRNRKKRKRHQAKREGDQSSA